MYRRTNSLRSDEDQVGYFFHGFCVTSVKCSHFVSHDFDIPGELATVINKINLRLEKVVRMSILLSILKNGNKKRWFLICKDSAGWLIMLVNQRHMLHYGIVITVKASLIFTLFNTHFNQIYSA